MKKSEVTNQKSGVTVHSIRLLPCPFCGETPEFSKHFKNKMWQLIHRCAVMPTMVIEWKSTQQEIAEQWNTRKQEQPGLFLNLYGKIN